VTSGYSDYSLAWRFREVWWWLSSLSVLAGDLRQILVRMYHIEVACMPLSYDQGTINPDLVLAQYELNRLIRFEQ